VVCSSLVARGVDAVPGEHLLTADSVRDWVETILRVLENPLERRRLSQAGRARMMSHHTWAGAMRRLDGLLEEHLGLR
jgi:glycosyltransferase involved in cell wall biosynthesis